MGRFGRSRPGAVVDVEVQGTFLVGVEDVDDQLDVLVAGHIGKRDFLVALFEDSLEGTAETITK